MLKKQNNSNPLLFYLRLTPFMRKTFVEGLPLSSKGENAMSEDKELELYDAEFEMIRREHETKTPMTSLLVAYYFLVKAATKAKGKKR